MRYLPHTEEDIQKMLETVGLTSMDGLFSPIPEDCRPAEKPALPKPISEWELNSHMDLLSSRIASGPDYKIYLGAGSYEHHIPSCIPFLVGRSEFTTAYTPYQPEVSQGTLQAVFEYQTLIARLLGMDISNASLYDGAMALAEALLMAVRVTRRKKVAVSRLIHPHYRHVMQTYFSPTEYEIIELPFDEKGQTIWDPLDGIEDLAATAIQSPNFFGCIEDIKRFSKKTHEQKALLVACFSEPLAYGMLKNPGSLGADIACGEGQSLGIPRSYGGPGLGILATQSKYMRNIPGRLVGQTKDRNGRRGFVLTLATREQHIRREKATSNICTNNSLCAVTAAMYMATLGHTGMRSLSRTNYNKSEYLKRSLKNQGVNIPFTSPTFNEFVVEFPSGFTKKYQHLLEKKLIAGLPLEPYFPKYKECYLLCVTETKTREDLDAFVKEVAA
jgi:glycine cleavage system P protein (glycine dehydrogenase) subunit 1